MLSCFLIRSHTLASLPFNHSLTLTHPGIVILSVSEGSQLPSPSITRQK